MNDTANCYAFTNELMEMDVLNRISNLTKQLMMSKKSRQSCLAVITELQNKEIEYKCKINKLETDLKNKEIKLQVKKNISDPEIYDFEKWWEKWWESVIAKPEISNETIEPLQSIFKPVDTDSKYIILYVLKLQQDKYYVGITVDFTNRLQKHKNGSGAYWTKKYPVLEVISIQNILEKHAKFEETKLTCEMMLKYGINNVRGAQYCQLHEFSETNTEEFKQLKFTISHFLDLDYNKIKI